VVGPPPSSWAVDPGAGQAFELAEGLWSLRLPLPWDDVPWVNAYAVARDDGIMLVDCGGAGHPTAIASLQRALRHSGHDIGDVRLLVGTHAHSDHIGLAEWVIERSGTEFWLHPDTGHFYDATRDPARIRAARARRARQEGVPEADVQRFADVEEETDGVMSARDGDRALAEGIRLPSLLGDWEVLTTPGHAPSHVSLLQRERGLLIAGDLVANAVSIYCDYGYSADPIGELLGSLRRVGSIDALELVLPGHGRPIADLKAAIAMQRDGIASGLEGARAALRAGAATGFQVGQAIYGDEMTGSIGPWRAAETFSFLRHLRVTGEATRETLPDGTFRHRLAA
jgi:glyoxylase-like metal-dependent hydrolase (beta-lactamase superfamily II)